MSATFEQLEQPSRSPGVLRKIASKWSELSLLGKLGVATFAVGATEVVMGGSMLITDSASVESADVCLGVGTWAVVYTAATGLYGTLKTRREDRASNYRNRKNFVPYVHQTEDGEERTSPYPAAVVGLKGEILGAGIVIGGLMGEDGDVEPIIAVQDLRARRGEVQLRGLDCFHRPIEDGEEDYATALSTDIAQALTLPASLYLWTLNHQSK